MPKIYHVNWFRRDDDGSFLWPGYGENIRVIDWIIRRLEGKEGIGVETPIGIVPTKEALNLTGLEVPKIDKLLSVPNEYWKEDAKEVRTFIEQQVILRISALFYLCSVTFVEVYLSLCFFQNFRLVFFVSIRFALLFLAGICQNCRLFVLLGRTLDTCTF